MTSQFNSSDITLKYTEEPYVNLTQMCKDAHRNLSLYLRGKKHKEYLKALSKELNVPSSDLIRIKAGGVPTEQGTYAHPLVAIHLAFWLSPQHAVAMASAGAKSLTWEIRKQEQALALIH